jgi:hypothetical protein
MHKVSTANGVNAPGSVGRGRVGKPAAQFPAFSRLRLVVLGGQALALNPDLNSA